MVNRQEEKTVYFVRHGQSEGNVSPVFQSKDSPLTALGEQQARQIAQRVSTLSFDRLIASPWPRTKQTADVIAEVTGMLPEVSELFVERTKPASVDGKPYTDAVVAKIYQEWNESLYTPGIRVEDGENYDDIMVRAEKALEFLEHRREQSLVVVTHGFFMRTMLAKILLGNSLTPAAYKHFQASTATENTGITVVKYAETKHGPGWYLWAYNDIAHLG